MKVVGEIRNVRLEELPQWAHSDWPWGPEAAQLCETQCSPALLEKSEQRLHGQVLRGQQDKQASTVCGTELPTYAEQREERTHRKGGPERHKLPQERSAKCTRGQTWQQSI